MEYFCLEMRLSYDVSPPKYKLSNITWGKSSFSSGFTAAEWLPLGSPVRREGAV
jgi:hypothetical protein